ncbi:SRPBCC family protein [Sunxiuqinia sp. sy24]|uniref:SRPBCC family protein n=1 Tax=Sunxiuqinia sp. sy24 TaxID=3461495 RepID=UPI00404543C9
MKTLKKFFIGLLFILIAMTVIAFFLPRQVHVERKGTIQAPAKVVFNQVNNLHTWDKWAVWNQMDPNMKVNFENTGIGKDAAYTWESEDPNLGSGKLTITASVPYDSIATTMNFMEKGLSTGYFLFEESGQTTTVTWAFNSDLGYNPLARWMGLLYDSMVGADFKKSIKNLKIVAETIVQEGRPIVELVTLPEFNYVSIRETIELEAVSTQMGVSYGQLMNFINQNDLMMSNMPYAIYHKIDGTRIDLECGIPVDYKPEPQGNILTGTMPSKTYATADHFGSYDQLEQTHSFIQQWIKNNGFRLAGSPMEQYLTDPQKEPDESKWVTAIYYPIN